MKMSKLHAYLGQATDKSAKPVAKELKDKDVKIVELTKQLRNMILGIACKMLLVFGGVCWVMVHCMYLLLFVWKCSLINFFQNFIQILLGLIVRILGYYTFVFKYI